MTRPRTTLVYRYVAVVTALGIALLAGVVAAGFGHITAHWPDRVLVYVPLVVLCELRPIAVRRGGDAEEIVVSSAFAFALLISAHLAQAALIVALASIVADAVHGKARWKLGFNAAQYTLALGAASAVLSRVDPSLAHRGALATGDLPAIALAGAAFFLVNDTLVGTGLALVQRESVRHFLQRDFWFQAATSAVLLSLAPVVVAASRDSLMMAPLLLLPIFAVHRWATTLLAKEHQALHDPLTDLPNRSLFRERSSEAVARAERSGHRAAVMLIDLDRFKEINDTLGHHVGDLLLQKVGPRLEDVLRGSDTIARLGGDEFGILLPEVATESQVTDVAHRILAALQQPVDLAEGAIDVDASIGIALFPDHGAEVDTLLQRADMAMYLAKETKSGYQVYRREADPYSPRHISRLHELRRALDGGELVVHYQPQADLMTGQVIGAEALVRWDHPELGLVAPDQFVHLAERCGLSRPLTLFVVEDALRRAAQWHESGLDLKIAVNVTARNLHDPSFPLDVANLVAAGPMPASCLQFEITESVVMADPIRAAGVMRRLSSMGIELALDDFGTGYSSLAHLKQLPVHELKIDKSFVEAMAKQGSDAVIVRSTIDLARNLGLRSVAEGVEDENDWAMLAALGCDVAQGYFLSRPMPAAELTVWLQRLDGVGPRLSAPRPASAPRRLTLDRPGAVVVRAAVDIDVRDRDGVVLDSLLP